MVGGPREQRDGGGGYDDAVEKCENDDVICVGGGNGDKGACNGGSEPGTRMGAETAYGAPGPGGNPLPNAAPGSDVSDASCNVCKLCNCKASSMLLSASSSSMSPGGSWSMLATYSISASTSTSPSPCMAFVALCDVLSSLIFFFFFFLHKMGAQKEPLVYPLNRRKYTVQNGCF